MRWKRLLIEGSTLCMWGFSRKNNFTFIDGYVMKEKDDDWESWTRVWLLSTYLFKQWSTTYAPYTSQCTALLWPMMDECNYIYLKLFVILQAWFRWGIFWQGRMWIQICNYIYIYIYAIFIAGLLLWCVFNVFVGTIYF